MLWLLNRQTHSQTAFVDDPYQQIYEWRGAVNAMSQITTPEFARTESFRFGPTIATLASRLLALLGEDTPVRGQEAIRSIGVDDPSLAPPVDAILCRKNVSAIWHLAVGVEAGHRPSIRMSPPQRIALWRLMINYESNRAKHPYNGAGICIFRSLGITLSTHCPNHRHERHTNLAGSWACDTINRH